MYFLSENSQAVKDENGQTEDVELNGQEDGNDYENSGDYLCEQ